MQQRWRMKWVIHLVVCTVLGFEVSTRLRELSPATRGGRDRGTRNLVLAIKLHVLQL